MAADNDGKKYVLGKGRLYFDYFPPGTKTSTGERYLGNTPELSVSSSQDTLDHFDADQGINVKDESVTIQDDMTGQLVTDNIDLENVGLFFGGPAEKLTVVAVTGKVENIVAKRGRWFQLGTTQANPDGTRSVTNIVIKKATVAVPALNNFEYDLPLARVWIEADAPGVADADPLEITYDQEAVVRNFVVGTGAEVKGALRFICTNPVGPKKDYFWPYIKLTANGDMSLKGDEWQQIPFSFEILKKDGVTQRVYIDDRPAA